MGELGDRLSEACNSAESDASDAMQEEGLFEYEKSETHPYPLHEERANQLLSLFAACKDGFHDYHGDQDSVEEGIQDLRMHQWWARTAEESLPPSVEEVGRYRFLLAVVVQKTHSRVSGEREDDEAMLRDAEEDAIERAIERQEREPDCECGYK